jgi:hypothetical protein
MKSNEFLYLMISVFYGGSEDKGTVNIQFNTVFSNSDNSGYFEIHQFMLK